jgi:hypothetical protein
MHACGWMSWKRTFRVEHAGERQVSNALARDPAKGAIAGDFSEVAKAGSLRSE